MRTTGNKSGKSQGKAGFLDGQMLIAMPAMSDDRFNRSVVYVCAHSAEGAMGIVINKPAADLNFSDLLVQLDIIPEAERIRLPQRGHYWRTISSAADGEWPLDERYRPRMAFPVRAGWLRAVLAGHARVARGLGIAAPILVLLSMGSANGLLWSEEMRRTDAVLDVNTISARALTLGRTVTVERIEGALHDVFLSPAPIRADAYKRLLRWLRAYG